MLNPYKYMLVTRGNVVICIKYTDNVIMDLFEHLYQRGWTIEVSDRETYESKSLNGGIIQSKYFDANTKIDI